MEVREASASYAGLTGLQGDVPPVGYKRTEVGVVPTDWVVVQAGELHPFVTSGSRGWAMFYSDTGAPFIRITNLARDSIYPDLQDLRFVKLDEGAREGMRTQLQTGDVLISITADIGIVGYVSAAVPKPAYINQHIALIRFDRSRICSKYVSYFWAAENSQRAFRAMTDSGAKAGMNLTTVKQILLAAPPTKAEQEAIAEALSDADALIESLEQLVAKKRQVKQGTMQALLTGKQRLPGFNDEWQRCHLADLVAFHKGKGLPKSALDAFAQTPCIHYGELFTQYAETIREVTSYTGQVADALFSYVQDVLMPTSDVTPTGLAKASCVTMKDVVLGGDILVIRPDTRRLFGPFLSYVIRYSKQQILQLVTGSTVFHIYASDMKKFTLAVPSIKEQEQIILVLDDMDTELVELETRLAKTRQLKQGMMQELLTGRIRLVQPALNVVPLPEKKETRSAAASPHNRQINEAVVIAALVKQFGSEDWPLARVRRTKLTYLLHRHAEGRADGFLKKAAGPYDPRTRYKGPEGIALKKGYVQALHNGTYEGFVASEHISEAETYFEKWYGTDVMDWLERFRLRKTDELELLTTVDMAMEDLRREGKPISVEAVRQLIHGHPEWKPKLERAIFSDDGIAAAIAECQALFAL